MALFVGATATAQTPVANPGTVSWDHPDYMTALKYEGGYFAYPVLNGECNWQGTPGAEPTMRDDLGKPQTTTGLSMSAPLGARPKGCARQEVSTS